MALFDVPVPECHDDRHVGLELLDSSVEALQDDVLALFALSHEVVHPRFELDVGRGKELHVGLDLVGAQLQERLLEPVVLVLGEPLDVAPEQLPVVVLGLEALQVLVGLGVDVHQLLIEGVVLVLLLEPLDLLLDIRQLQLGRVDLSLDQGQVL